MLKNIKELREEFGISQQKLADAIGMSQQSINGYENRDIEPDIATLIKIADYFETSVDFIIEHTRIRHKIEESKQYAFDRREIKLIDGYRSLPDSRKKLLEVLVDDMLGR